MNGVERSNDGVIQQAIESAKCRIYKLNFDMNGNISPLHQRKAENQKELMEITIKALEKYNALERVIERLEECAKVHFEFWDEFDDEQSFGSMNAYMNAISFIKEEVG